VAESDRDREIAKSVEGLSPKEAYALRHFKFSKQAEISPSKSAEMYELYQNGTDCEGIRKLNPGFGLGQIVHARVRDGWDVKKEEYQHRLLETAGPRVMQAQVESTQFLADMLAAAVKMNWEAVKRYLQDGNKDHLKDTPLEGGVTMRQMREIIDTLQVATGQDKKKVVKHEGELTVRASKRVNQEQAADVLAALATEAPKKE
jgi:polyhydroxyalkanoate synthesis regulator phasin